MLFSFIRTKSIATNCASKIVTKDLGIAVCNVVSKKCNKCKCVLQYCK